MQKIMFLNVLQWTDMPHGWMMKELINFITYEKTEKTRF